MTTSKTTSLDLPRKNSAFWSATNKSYVAGLEIGAEPWPDKTDAEKGVLAQSLKSQCASPVRILVHSSFF